MHYSPSEGILHLDSAKPDFEQYLSFLNNEVRFNALMIKNKTFAEEILNEQKENAIKRYQYYENLSKKSEN
jgi:pyruvate-ferredoxin/flavodoxin oxidoreductase